MKIGIDIDGTITTPYYWLDFFNENLNRDLKVEDIKHYDHYKDFKITEKEFIDFRNEYLKEIHLLAVPRSEAVHYVNRLFHENESTYLITARENELTLLTKSWLNDNGIKSSDLYHLGSTKKTKLALSLKLDVFLEDRYETALNMALAGIPTILFNTTYNQEGNHPLIYRVDTWEEAFLEVENLKLKKSFSKFKYFKNYSKAY